MASTKGANSIRQGTALDNSIPCLPGMRVNTRHMNPTNCISSNSMTLSRIKTDPPLEANAATQVFMHKAEACNVPAATLSWHCFTLQLYCCTLWYCIVLHYNYIVLPYGKTLFHTIGASLHRGSTVSHCKGIFLNLQCLGVVFILCVSDYILFNDLSTFVK